MELLIILATLVLSGFFSGSEIAFVSANRLKLEIESRKDSFSARSLAYFTERPEQYLTTTLLGNNIINVLYATLMALFLETPIRTAFQGWLGYEAPGAIILVTQTVIAAVLIMVLGEIIPKSIFHSQSNFMMGVVAAPMRIIHGVLRPLVHLAERISDLLISRIGLEAEKQEMIFRRQDIEMLFKELKDSGGGEDFDREDSEILHNVMGLSTIRVKECMIPRTEIVAVEQNTSLDEVLKAFISSGYSKLPVYRETIDDVIGVIFAYDLFTKPARLKEIIRPVTLIPSSKRAQDLLTEFRLNNLSMAVVIDEYGGTAGLITSEDLVEEVVGDIQDEYDVEESFARRLNENTFVISGSYELEELLKEYPEIRIPFPEDSEYETIAGFVIQQCGRIPKVNEELMLHGNKFIISKGTPSRIETLKLILLPPDA